jgi:hypothetical protein
MRVVVPALSRDNVASRCLAAEQLEHEVRVLEHSYAYAELIAELWRDGESFTIVEDDIAPYPGAVKALEACRHYWCGFHYCLPGRFNVDDDGAHSALLGSNGCFKITADVIEAAPELYERWDTHHWSMVDVALTAALRHVFGLERGPSEKTFHVHTPPVAHAMHYRPETDHGRSQVSTPEQILG